LNDIDLKFMKQALREARRGLGRVSPNPAVGAVIVRKGEVVARGYHRMAGLPHAETAALDKLEQISPGDSLYITLEPCNHLGRTPPCTHTILKSGIKRVVIGMKDPNPMVAGGGCEFLKDNGIEVVENVLETECRRLNEDFLKFVESGRPFVIAKSALTMDGWIATSSGHSQWITNDKSRQFVHRLRDRVDAVMVGIGTVLADDPSLTTRLTKGKGRDPLRIIVDTHLRTPLNAKVMNQDSPADTLVVTSEDAGLEDQEKFRAQGVPTLVCPTRAGRIDLNTLMTKLGEMSITSLLVEGGASITGSMLREGLIDKFYIFKAPKLFGGDDGIPMTTGPGAKRMDECVILKQIKTRRFGDDILIRGYPVYQERLG